MPPEAPPAHPPPRLLDRLRAAIRVKHFSSRTEEAYVGWARRYIVFHRKRHPAEMGAAEVAAFLTCISASRTGGQVSARGCRVGVAVPVSRGTHLPGSTMGPAVALSLA